MRWWSGSVWVSSRRAPCDAKAAPIVVDHEGVPALGDVGNGEQWRGAHGADQITNRRGTPPRRPSTAAPLALPCARARPTVGMKPAVGARVRPRGGPSASREGTSIGLAARQAPPLRRRRRRRDLPARQRARRQRGSPTRRPAAGHRARHAATSRSRSHAVARPADPVASGIGPCPDTDLMPTVERHRPDRALDAVPDQRSSAAATDSSRSSRTRASTAPRQAHSDDMVANGYFEHVSPSGSTPESRA